MQGRATGRTLESLRGEHWNPRLCSTRLFVPWRGVPPHWVPRLCSTRHWVPRRSSAASSDPGKTSHGDSSAAPSGMTSGKTSHEGPGVEQLVGCTSTAYGHLQYAGLRALTVRKPPGQISTTASGHLRQYSAAWGSAARGSTASWDSAAASGSCSSATSHSMTRALAAAQSLTASGLRALTAAPGQLAGARAFARQGSAATSGPYSSTRRGQSCSSAGRSTGGSAEQQHLRQHLRQHLQQHRW